ncbi:MAG: hypothetical protein AAFY34_05080 [Pseudomonadota bacterium]
MQTSSQILANGIAAPIDLQDERQPFVNEISSNPAPQDVVKRPRILERRNARWARRIGH